MFLGVESKLIKTLSPVGNLQEDGASKLFLSVVRSGRLGLLSRSAGLAGTIGSGWAPCSAIDIFKVDAGSNQLSRSSGSFRMSSER